jgi:hypothetical protein
LRGLDKLDRRRGRGLEIGSRGIDKLDQRKWLGPGGGLDEYHTGTDEQRTLSRK